jgi:probable HAF family extracellular repeat protein
VTGFYVTDESPVAIIGFVMQNGRFTIVDVPGSAFTNPVAVNANGEVVGVHQNADGTYSGFHWRDGVSTTFAAPGPGVDLTTQANGINNGGVIAGVRLNMAQESSGFVYASGQFSPVHVPGTPGESAVSINGPGELLGESYVPDGRHHAFIAYPATPVTIDVMPGDLSNTIHLTSNEKVRVAILSSPTFDATTIDPLSVSFAGASARVVGRKAKPKVWTKDLARDGRMDLLLEFDVVELQLSSSETFGFLQARTFNGAYVVGTDAVYVIP